MAKKLNVEVSDYGFMDRMHGLPRSPVRKPWTSQIKNMGSSKVKTVLITAVLLCMAVEIQTQAGQFQELIFIDHQNLRYVEDSKITHFQIGEIKRNIDQAKKYGLEGYLLFAKETMEAMLTYDFEVQGIGNIGLQAFPPGSKHRREAERLRKAMREVLDYANDKGIKMYFHSNQFIFSEEVLDVIKSVTWGTAVCPGREATWAVYRGKIDEFFCLFPEIAGLQITGDETQVSVLKCQCERCRNMTFVERVNRLTNETADVAKKYNKQVQMRTWQRMGELGSPANMEQGVLDNVYFSIKNTNGDFRLPNGLDEEFLTAAVPKRLVVEFDAWREYEGHNYFPCWMGEVWAPRFKFVAKRGIPRLGVRLMWNSNKNPIFDRPWGNFVNIYTFLKLAENPNRSAQDILVQFVKEHYPPSAHQAAIELYQYSMEFQQIMYYCRGEYLANHSRVQDEDAEDNLEEIQDDGFLKTTEDFEARRRDINSAYEKAIGLVEQLGKDVPAEWIQGLKDGARVEHYVALATTDKMEAIFLQQSRKAGHTVAVSLQNLKERMDRRAQQWKTWHPDSFESMEGQEMFEPFKENRN